LIQKNINITILMKTHMKTFYLMTMGFCLALNLHAQRSEYLLEKGWKFTKGEVSNAEMPAFNDAKWETVDIPHDWAILGPFDKNNDLQNVAVTQNFETQASLKTGRTGGLPYVGIGWYRTTFHSTPGKQTTLIFDGAMSEARVFVNGKEACFWPCGYNSFYCDVTSLVNEDGKNNTLAVRLENRPQSSRWYPGAGLYRNVHVVTTEKIHVPVWGTQITTPCVKDEYASVCLRTTILNAEKTELTVVTDIMDADGQVVSTKTNKGVINHGQPFTQNFIVERPKLWSPETPVLYKAVSKIYSGDTLLDTYSTRFGIRTIEYIADKGFYLNGKRRKFQGVCNHHDLGPLGAAINVAALRHQLTLLKEMGCDAIRTSHNMPAPELVELCDEMGFMMMLEPFDEWDIAKCDNGYHRFFNEWAEKDMVNMLRQYRNNPCVVMWSIGNEVPTQWSPEGYKVAKFLQDICHREDPTRPVTCGMDQVKSVLANGFAAMLDIPGLNYRAHLYDEAYERLPQNIILGSETSSTVSSRGVYKFPVERKAGAMYDDHQSSSYDLEYCNWSNIPDIDFARAEDHEWTIGQFVWTGFDYLGEPSPYDTNAWPNHSSMFGIIDLASIPKDRYYLYRSVWNKEAETLHILPHWNWEGREGEKTPVFVYTNYPSAELFINGKSYGRQTKHKNGTVENRYRLMWHDAVYQPGEVRVVAYDEQGNPVAEKTVRTAGKPHHIELVTDRSSLQADGKDLAYVTLRIVDKDGNLCPNDGRLVSFKVKGAGKYRASANGDPTCLDLFHKPEMHAFGGMLTVIVQSGEKTGEIELQATAKGIKTGTIRIPVK
jgi:beta-galactosidase